MTKIKTQTSVETSGCVERVNAMQCSTIDATSPYIHGYIGYQGEALQFSHHNYTYDSEFVRHVVGSTHGEIISSVRVRFSGYIREEYGKCLHELKDFTLPSAYDQTKGCLQKMSFSWQQYQLRILYEAALG